ncbi:NADH-quinone oxidoreductase subunit C [Pectinatus frisingensis]|jgi:NADH-quinone oxidoreductase subunit C|uniref:NADH-quinone oxidoreductase subunit C n=1 Tax=Pectinatus frisingensis TaxID=865 RepID=UPI0018C731E5|nr:NADH-quinone oxidoreductase subunit C [Pectinatus frisingensis]
MKRSYLSRDKLVEIENNPLYDIDFDEQLSKPPVTLKKGGFLSFMKLLKNEYGFDMLSNVTSVDYVDHFEVVYDLVNRSEYEELMIKVFLKRETPEIPSLMPLWPEVDFQEREQYDLMGIKFIGHPDLRRILMPDNYEDHPLRKDFKANFDGSGEQSD